MSAVAHFFVVVGGSKIHERLAHFFIDIYTPLSLINVTQLHERENNFKNAKKPLDIFVYRAIIQKLSDSATEFGGIAQLGERLNGIQEVSGSIPLISTTES